MIKKMKKALVWYWLLNKRLLKKLGFIAILMLIPIMAFTMTFFVKTEDSGMIRIAVVAVEPEDTLVQNAIGNLQNDGNVFVFSRFDSVDEAKRCVENKTVDAAWVFEADFTEKVIESARGGNESLVSVYAVQDNIFFKASKEKIFSALLPGISYEVFKAHVEEMLPDGGYTDEQLRERYDFYQNEEALIEFSFLDSEQADIEETNYLTSTIRGLMAVVMMLSGLASTMFFLSDEKSGIYSWLNSKQRFAVLFFGNVAALCITAVFAIVALVLSDNVVSLQWDVAITLLYVVMVAAFCTLLGAIINSVNGIVIMLPTLLVASLVMCPVFFNTEFFKPVQVILPPYLYLFAINNHALIKWMVLYAAVTVVLAFVVYCVVRNKEFLRFDFKGGKKGN